MPHPNGEPTNAERAERIRVLGERYQQLLGEPPGQKTTFDTVTGILADIRHWCHDEFERFDEAVRISNDHFTQEWASEQPEVTEALKFRNDTTKALIYGYAVELDLFEENGEQRSQCTVSYGRFSASLELLQHQEALDDPDSIKLPVDSKYVNAIVRWALDNGY